MTTEMGPYEIRPIGPGRASLVVRVYSGVVTAGTCFTEACEIERVDPEQVARRIPVAKINLAVERLVFFRHEIEFLDEGLTGLVEVAGSGLEHIAPGMTLRASSPDS